MVQSLLTFDWCLRRGMGQWEGLKVASSCCRYHAAQLYCDSATFLSARPLINCPQDTSRTVDHLQHGEFCSILCTRARFPAAVYEITQLITVRFPGIIGSFHRGICACWICYLEPGGRTHVMFRATATRCVGHTYIQIALHREGVKRDTMLSEKLTHRGSWCTWSATLLQWEACMIAACDALIANISSTLRNCGKLLSAANRPSFQPPAKARCASAASALPCGNSRACAATNSIREPWAMGHSLLALCGKNLSAL